MEAFRSLDDYYTPFDSSHTNIREDYITECVMGWNTVTEYRYSKCGAAKQ